MTPLQLSPLSRGTGLEGVSCEAGRQGVREGSPLIGVGPWERWGFLEQLPEEAHPMERWQLILTSLLGLLMLVHGAGFPGLELGAG